jgi:hypothetical protein
MFPLARDAFRSAFRDLRLHVGLVDVASEIRSAVTVIWEFISNNDMGINIQSTTVKF